MHCPRKLVKVVSHREMGQHQALVRDLNRVLATLLDAGEDPNARDSDRETPRHEARSVTAVELLLAARANANVRDDECKTELGLVRPGSVAYRLSHSER